MIYVLSNAKVLKDNKRVVIIIEKLTVKDEKGRLKSN